MFLWRVVVVLVALAVTGCSTIHFKMPANRFDSPETRGGLAKIHVDPAILQGGTKVELASGFIYSPPPVNDVKLTSSSLDYALGAGIGLLDRLDLEFKYPDNAPTQLGLKFQFFGQPQNEAKQGNLSAAVTFAGGAGSDSGSESTFPLFGGTAVRSDYSLKFYNLDAGLIAGYRVHDSVLLYGGPFYAHYAAKGEIIQPAGSQSVYRFGGVGNQWGWSLGTEIDAPNLLYFMLDLAWAHASFQTATHVDWWLGGLAGIRL